MKPGDFLSRNLDWARHKKSRQGDYFSELSKGQKPEILVIGCSDSRVSPEEIMGAEAGEIFVHRNIANLVNHDDKSLMAVLEYAVNHLKVKHIIVLGHTGCGGIRAVFDNDDTLAMEEWLKTARVVRENNPQASYEQLIELSIIDQCRKLSEMMLVKDSLDHRGAPEVHAWLYRMEEGEIKSLAF